MENERPVNTNVITITLDRDDYLRMCSAIKLVISEHHLEREFDFDNMFSLYDTVRRDLVKHDALRGAKND